MDFDLFELEDDDMLASMCISQSGEVEFIHNPLPFFNCSGEDSLHAPFSTESFVRNLFIFNESRDLQNLVELTDYKFKSSYLSSTHIADHVFNQIRTHLQTLWADIKGLQDVDLPSYWERRRQVTMLLHLIRAHPKSISASSVAKGLILLRTLLNRLANINILKTIYMANSIKGNETDTPSYHFLHGFLEWRFLDLVILCEQDQPINNESIHEGSLCKSAAFESQYFKVLNNLLLLTIPLYKRLKLPDLLFSSPFACTCIKECWLLMQFLAEKIGGNDLFWRFFNQTIDDMKSNPEKYHLTAQNIPEVTIFLLKGLVRLQGYKTNGTYEGPCHHRVIANNELLEAVVEAFLNSSPPEEKLRIFMCISIPILSEWWPPKVDVPMTLWEYFHKKLNSAFFITGSAPSNLAISSSSGKDFLMKVQGLLENMAPDVNHTSFTLYTMILGKTIRRFIQLGQNHQTQKILGRIFSKFSATKFLALNEVGIHHLIELFLALALSVESDDIIFKLRDKLLSIPLTKLTPNRQACLVKGHLALLIFFAERSMDLTDYVKSLLDQIVAVKGETALSKLVAESLCDIFEYADTFDRGENLLIDSWLSSYLSLCTSAEQERLLETLHNVFTKIKSNILKANQSNANTQTILQAFSQHILPFAKQNFMTSFSSHLPSLAADFCIIGSHGTLSSKNEHFQKLFKFFVEAHCNNKQAVPQFLLTILASDESALVDQTIIIQVWLRSLVVLSPNNEDVLNLSKIIVNLDDFQLVSGLTAEELLSAKEPLCVFVSSVGKIYSNCVDHNRKIAIHTKFNSYLVNFEKWISDKNEKSEVSFRFYSFIAITIFNCALLVYSRNKSSCFFHTAITRFILPTTLQTGKTPDQKLAHIIHKVWPVIVQGIGTLNFRSDPYINKTLVDLIIKWTPHFKISTNAKVVAKPFISCLSADNDQLSAFIFEKLASNFLTTQRRQLGPFACLIITIFQEVIDAHLTVPNKLLLFLKHTCLVTLEHMMMVDEIVASHKMITDLLRKIIRSSAYESSNDIKELLLEVLKTLAVKHLSYYAFFYFGLLSQIGKLDYALVIEVKDFLKQQIAVVEEKRGGGQDVSLRGCFQKLYSTVTSGLHKI